MKNEDLKGFVQEYLAENEAFVKENEVQISLEGEKGNYIKMDKGASKRVSDNLTCCAITISMSSFWCKSPKCPYIYLKIKILENKLLNFSNITGFSKNTIEGHT